MSHGAIGVLVVDDDALFARSVKRYLEGDGMRVGTAGDLRSARSEAANADVLIVDQHLPDGRGLDWVAELRRAGVEAKVLLCTAAPRIPDAREALKLGVLDFIVKPVDLDELRLSITHATRLLRLEREARALRRERGEASAWIALDPAMRELDALLAAASTSEAPVLVLGETGTGKTRLARELHRRSARRDAPFVHVNCAALPTTLVESELFGYERGAFTGAQAAHPGLLELADGGTLFLDEVGELPTTAQAKLLVALDEGVVRRLGSKHARAFDVRVVAATNTDVDTAREDGRLRNDFYFRLAVLVLRVPPLRDRPLELPALVQSLLDARHHGRFALAEGELERLVAHPFPGNVRELRNSLDRAMLLDPVRALRPSRQLLPVQPVPAPACSAPAAEEASAPGGPSTHPVGTTLDEFERWFVSSAVERHAGNLARAARELGIAVPTLRRKLRAWGHPRGQSVS
jgi:two-component system, NtrC family, response regulator AtoC